MKNFKSKIFGVANLNIKILSTKNCVENALLRIQEVFFAPVTQIRREIETGFNQGFLVQFEPQKMFKLC